MRGHLAARTTRGAVRLRLLTVVVANAGVAVVGCALEGPARLLVASVAILPLALGGLQFGFTLLRRLPPALPPRPLLPLTLPRNLRIVGTAGSP